MGKAQRNLGKSHPIPGIFLQELKAILENTVFVLQMSRDSNIITFLPYLP